MKKVIKKQQNNESKNDEYLEDKIIQKEQDLTDIKKTDKRHLITLVFGKFSIGKSTFLNSLFF